MEERKSEDERVAEMKFYGLTTMPCSSVMPGGKR